MNRVLFAATIAVGVALIEFGALAPAPDTHAEDVLSSADPPFKGKISLSAKNSIPDWPKPVKAPDGAPNILLIMLDDVGFADTSTFGGVTQTPALDKLAAEGLRYNRFHTVGLCTPTRAALLSGRNHHRMGFGTVGEAGYPGYNGMWRKDTASVAEVLRRNGYSTAAFGKWHNTPFHEISPVGPFDRWPTSLGFEYYYGNMLGVSSQWEPVLWRNTQEVPQPKTAEEGYHYTTDIADDAIHWLHTQRSLAPEKPYFIYFATGAAHDPHHVSKTWIEKYNGRFDQGWDKLREDIFARQKELRVIPAETTLTPRPKELPLWSNLSPDEKRLAARQMEVYAAFLSHTDYEIGRLIDAVRAALGRESTLILYIVGDNGASAESAQGIQPSPSNREKLIEELGGPKYMNRYAAGWAIAGNAPFQWAKGIASHFGATRNPLVVSWPARIKDRGGLRTQFTHVNDVAATVYEATGIQMPDMLDGVKQLPMDGTSFAYSFDDKSAPSRHASQYFEIWGNRAMYKDGWIATARHGYAWEVKRGENFDSWASFEDDAWELYNIDKDFSEARNLADKHPDKLQELKSLFEEEARRNNVYPLISNNIYGYMNPRAKRTSVTYYPGLASVPAFNGPRLSDSPSFLGTTQDFSIEARVEIPKKGAEGIIVSDGSRFGGFVLYVKDDRLIYEYNSGAGHVKIVSQAPLPRGQTDLSFEFVREQGKAQKAETAANVNAGAGRLYVNGQLAGEGKVVPAWPFFGSFGVGQAFGTAVSTAFQPPFKFTGSLINVQIKLK